MLVCVMVSIEDEDVAEDAATAGTKIVEYRSVFARVPILNGK